MKEIRIREPARPAINGSKLPRPAARRLESLFDGTETRVPEAACIAEPTYGGSEHHGPAGRRLVRHRAGGTATHQTVCSDLIRSGKPGSLRVSFFWPEIRKMRRFNECIVERATFLSVP